MTTNDQMRALCEAATEGPWHSKQNDHSYTIFPVNGPQDGIVSSYGHYRTQESKKSDAAFIAASRQWVPQALTQLSEQAARVKILEDALEMLFSRWENGTPCHEFCGEDGEVGGNSLGNAFKLTAEEESQIIALIPKALKGAGK